MAKNSKSAIAKREPPKFEFDCKAQKYKSLYIDRMSDALTLFCGGNAPPAQFVKDWLSGQSEHLQDWVACNCILHWSTGIGIIEAAQHAAEHCEEGREHLGFGEQHKEKQ